MKNIQLPVPIIGQSDRNACVAATSLAIYLYWKGENSKYGYEYEISKLLDRKLECGSYSEFVSNAFKKLRFKVKYETDLSIEQLQEYLKAGVTIMLFMQGRFRPKPKNWENIWNVGHAVALVGIRGEKIFLMDPRSHSAYVWLPIEEFLDRWHCIARIGSRDYGSALVISNSKPAAILKQPKLERML